MTKNHLSIEELIEAAKKLPTKNETEKLNNVEKFILDIGVVEDLSNEVPTQNIYWIYHKWSEYKGTKRLNRKLFFTEFGRIFKRRFKSGSPVYYVNKQPFELSMDEWWEMRKHFRMHKDAIETYKEYVKEKKTPRNKTKYPGLMLNKNSKIKQEYMDQDYINELSDKEKQFLSDFNEEYYGANLNFKDLKKNRFHRTKKDKKACTDRNNARNRCIYGIQRAQGRLLPIIENAFELEESESIESVEETESEDYL